MEEPLAVSGATVWHAARWTCIAPDNKVAAAVSQRITEAIDRFTVDWHEANPRDTAAEGE
jgi:DNA polymerase III psi subunit